MNKSAFEHMLLNTLVENVPHRIYAKNVNGRFIFANNSVVLGMGASKVEDLLGKTDFEFYP
jgi:diguanylate cyclase